MTMRAAASGTDKCDRCPAGNETIEVLRSVPFYSPICHCIHPISVSLPALTAVYLTQSSLTFCAACQLGSGSNANIDITGAFLSKSQTISSTIIFPRHLSCHNWSQFAFKVQTHIGFRLLFLIGWGEGEERRRERERQAAEKATICALARIISHGHGRTVTYHGKQNNRESQPVDHLPRTSPPFSPLDLGWKMSSLPAITRLSHPWRGWCRRPFPSGPSVRSTGRAAPPNPGGDHIQCIVIVKGGHHRQTDKEELFTM